MNRRSLIKVAVLLCFFTSFAHAQGVQTGTLTGKLRSSDGVALPDAVVAVTSSSLQGARAATSDINGVYVVTNLPPGNYLIRISKSGLAQVERRAIVPLGATATIDVTLAPASVAESIVVEATAPAPLIQTQGATNIPASDINQLPMGRTPYLAAELVPGVTTNTPNANQITISGGFAYDNVFLVDGVDVNDNLLGTSNDLFIEDAISEVQVLASGITAEYGRFSGGVVNVITKSGGNRVSGSYRTNFNRPSWTRETPFEQANAIRRGQPTAANPFATNHLSIYTELSGGGPAVKDRLWLFAAGRLERSSMDATLQQTAIPYTKTNNSKRYEAKATGALRQGHTLQGTFIDNRVHRGNEPVLSFSIDKAAFISPSTPNRLGVVSYAGALSSRMLVSAQYSQKRFATEGVGSTATAIVDSPFLTRTGTQYQYNAPLFDASDPEQRNNRQLTASLTYFLSHRRVGSHELKGGVEDFVDTRVGANSQSSTGYVFQSNFKVDAAGVPVLDAEGRAIPVFMTGTSRLQQWFPHRGARFDMTTVSAYMQDRWVATPRLTLSLGLRYEHAASDASTGGDSVDANRVVPRLAAAYDVAGDGRTIVLGTYAQYSGKYNDAQFSRNTLVGNSDRFTTVYTGPNGEGRDFAPGFDPANYAGPVVAASFPTLNVLFDDNLSSPLTHEFTVGAAHLLGSRTSVKALYVQRHTTNFVEDFAQLANGISNIVVNGVAVGTTDNILYQNSDLPKRDYRALQFEGQHRLLDAFSVNGQWTVQLRNAGNFEGESPNPTGSALGDYPEMLVLTRNAPEGRLDDFQRSKVRVWASYRAGLGRYGSLAVAPLVRYNSGKTYSLAVIGQPLSTVQASRNPGYANTVTQTVFFGSRGSESFNGYGLLDLALTYEVPVWHRVRPWIKFESFNLLNNQKLISWDTTITADPTSPKDENGLPTGYVKGPRFGTAIAAGNYAAPRAGLDGGRMIDCSVGFRF